MKTCCKGCRALERNRRCAFGYITVTEKDLAKGTNVTFCAEGICKHKTVKIPDKSVRKKVTIKTKE